MAAGATNGLAFVPRSLDPQAIWNWHVESARGRRRIGCMNLVSKSDRGDRCVRQALACLSAALLIGCQTEAVVLSPAMHTRVVDGLAGKPLDHVRVTLLSRDAP